MATQYTLDLSLANTASDAALQSILSYLNPSLGAMTPSALAEFQGQLEALSPSGMGNVSLTSVTLDANATTVSPLLDIKVVGGPNTELSAGAGFDTILGSAGDTLDGSTSSFGGANLIAGAGEQTLYAGAGSDTLSAGSGSDTLYGGTGADTINGSSSRSGHALIYGGSGDDLIKTGAGSDTVYCGTGDATVKGGSGASTVNAGSGHDSVYGGSGAMTFVVTAANFKNDSFTGGTGKSVFELSDLTANDVSVKTNATTHVTTVSFDGSTTALKGVNEIHFAGGGVQTLH